MAEAFQYDVFLSHSSKDKAVVRPLAERLRRDRVPLPSPAARRRPGMNPLFGKLAVVACLFGIVAIRAPHGRRSRTLRVAEDRKGVLEIVLLIGVTLGSMVLPIVWVATGFPAQADYPLHPVPYTLGLLVMLAGLWLFYRSHADLGTNWSVTLQTRESHQLVTTGIYTRIRHPMYTAIFLVGIAHLLFVPNWIVARAYFLSFAILYVLRVAREERMMLDRFGSEYETYMQRTGRLLPRFDNQMKADA
jgi:protein-S-isoprenylcysteine O-methyltransferase Ste14